MFGSFARGLGPAHSAPDSVDFSNLGYSRKAQTPVPSRRLLAREPAQLRWTRGQRSSGGSWPAKGTRAGLPRKLGISRAWVTKVLGKPQVDASAEKDGAATLNVSIEG